MQGIGQALMEVAVYDGDGQLLTGSLAVFQTPVGSTGSARAAC